MSKIQVDEIVDKLDAGAPSFTKGVTVTGVATATSFSGNLAGNVSATSSVTVGSAVTITSSGANITGIMTATSFEGSASNMTGITGKAAAMSIVFG